MAKNTRSRRAFEFKRDNLWVIDPDAICIIGGKSLPPDEQGPLDTALDTSHDLYDERLSEPLTEEFVNNIDAHGVDTPILFVKLDDVATLIAGRRRVRAARVVNKRRAARGEPLLKIDGKLKRAAGSGLLAAMIVENEARSDDGILTKIDKLKRLMNRGVSAEDCAVHFGVGLTTIKGWLAFEDHATPETKDAARKGRLSASAAAELAKIADPNAQNERLAQMLSTHKRVSARAARDASRAERGRVVGVTDRKTQRGLLQVVSSTTHPSNTSERTLAWWQGVEAALKAVVGDQNVDPRIQNKLQEVAALRASKLDKKTK